jgi:hypothetical protein
MTFDSNTAQPPLATALGELAERCLDQGQVCCLCQWHAAVAARVYLPDGQANGLIRGCVLPLCGFCLCAPDLPDRLAQALSRDRAQERAAWN